MSKVMVSEFLSLDGPDRPGEAERRVRRARFEHGGWQLPSLDDAGRALEWSTPTLIQGRSDERAGTQDPETKRLGWTR